MFSSATQERPTSLKVFRLTLGIVLASSLVLHVFTLWRERDNIAAAHGDFVIYYTGAKILADGRAARLYDLTVQKEYQATLDVPFRPEPLPFNHPAFELLLFLPLARLTYANAFMVWTLVNVILVIGIARLLSCTVDAENRKLAALLCAAFFPVAATVWHGQDSILSTFLASWVLVNLKRGRDRAAGVVLALGLYKPQLVLPVAAILAIDRRAVVMPFLIAGAVLAGISALMTGWSGVVQFVQLLVWMNHTHYSIDPARMANLRGLFENLAWIGGSRELIVAVTATASIAVLYWSLRQWNANRAGGEKTNEPFAHLIIATLLVSYHLYVHDLTLFVIPLVTLLNRASRRQGMRSRNVLLVMLVIFSLPVVSQLLSLRMLSWAAVGLFLTAALLAREIHPAAAEAPRTDSAP